MVSYVKILIERMNLKICIVVKQSRLVNLVHIFLYKTDCDQSLSALSKFFYVPILLVSCNVMYCFSFDNFFYCFSFVCYLVNRSNNDVLQGNKFILS